MLILHLNCLSFDTARVPSLIRENERRTEPLIATYTVKVENLAVKIL